MFVISGATGNTGAVVAQTLLDQGQPVRVIVRTAAKGESWKAKGADVAVADYQDIDAMTNALEGAAGAYFLLPPDLENERFIEESFERAAAIVEAAKAARLPHAVILSSVGAQHADGVGPISTVANLEKLFVQASIPLTAVRPGYFLENIQDVMPVVMQEGVYPSMILPLDLKIDMVATQDIGATIAEALVNPTPEAHRVIELQGAARYSAVDIAAELSRRLDREIAPIAVPLDAQVAQLKASGLSNQSAESLAEMHEAISNGRIAFTDPGARKATVSLETYLAEIAA